MPGEEEGCSKRLARSIQDTNWSAWARFLGRTLTIALLVLSFWALTEGEMLGFIYGASGGAVMLVVEFPTFGACAKLCSGRSAERCGTWQGRAEKCCMRPVRGTVYILVATGGLIVGLWMECGIADALCYLLIAALGCCYWFAVLQERCCGQQQSAETPTAGQSGEVEYVALDAGSGAAEREAALKAELRRAQQAEQELRRELGVLRDRLSAAAAVPAPAAGGGGEAVERELRQELASTREALAAAQRAASAAAAAAQRAPPAAAPAAQSPAVAPRALGGPPPPSPAQSPAVRPAAVAPGSGSPSNLQAAAAAASAGGGSFPAAAASAGGGSFPAAD